MIVFVARKNVKKFYSYFAETHFMFIMQLVHAGHIWHLK